MNYKVISRHEVGNVIEFTMDIGDWSYLVIYGKHINGYFCAVPNWGVGCEMSKSDSIAYNATKLATNGIEYGSAKAIAEAIREVWDNEH